jgi:hypothetical protein
LHFAWANVSFLLSNLRAKNTGIGRLKDHLRGKSGSELKSVTPLIFTKMDKQKSPESLQGSYSHGGGQFPNPHLIF